MYLGDTPRPPGKRALPPYHSSGVRRLIFETGRQEAPREPLKKTWRPLSLGPSFWYHRPQGGELRADSRVAHSLAVAVRAL